MKRLLSTLAMASGLALSTSQAWAIAITPNTNATDLTNALLGGGGGISLVGTPTFTGGTGSIVSAGTFTGGLSSGLGFDSGVALTSGDVTLLDNVNDGDGATGDFGGAGDSDLDALIPQSTNDATVLEFDFTTTTGNLFFNYVFGSEEYNEWVGSTFNDVFAFFVNGVNVAIAPDGEPVSINNVNCGDPFIGSGPNCEVYNNNDPSDGGPFFDFEYDGFTDSLVAQASGLGAGTHNIKLAIADAGDFSLDSGVFLQASSFQSEPSEVPVPSVLALYCIGLLGLGASLGLRRRS